MTDERTKFEAWWADFQEAHEDWKFADREALLFAAWQAALASQQKPVPAGLDEVAMRVAKGMNYLTGATGVIEFAHRLVAELTKGQKPFGVWHQGDTEDESDFFLGDSVDANCCGHCIELFAAPIPAEEMYMQRKNAQLEAEIIRLSAVVKQVNLLYDHTCMTMRDIKDERDALKKAAEGTPGTPLSRLFGCCADDADKTTNAEGKRT